jgi:hypothetical protein
MAVYETSKSKTSGISVSSGWNRQVITDVAIVAMTTAMLDSNTDDVGLLYVPAGAVIVGATLSATDMDTGSPALAIDVGDASDEDRIFAASAVGQAGTLSSAIATTGFLYKYTTSTQLRAYIQTAAATAAAGTLYFSVSYFVDPEFSTTALVAAV